MTELSDQELSRRVAESLGWSHMGTWNDPSWGRDVEGRINQAIFATDLAAAMTLVAADVDFELRKQNDAWKATFFRPSSEWSAWERTAARSICVAWLAMRGK